MAAKKNQTTSTSKTSKSSQKKKGPLKISRLLESDLDRVSAGHACGLTKRQLR